MYSVDSSTPDVLDNSDVSSVEKSTSNREEPLIADTTGEFGRRINEMVVKTMRSFECVNEDGTSVCRIDVELSDTPQENLQKITSLVMHANAGPAIDILSDTLSGIGKNVDIFVRSKKSDVNRSLNGTIVLDELESPIDLAILLHEVGHEWQSTRSELKFASAYTSAANQFGNGFQNTVQPPDQAKVDDLLNRYPMLSCWMNGEKEKKYLHILKKRSQIFTDIGTQLSIKDKKLKGWSSINPLAIKQLKAAKKEAEGKIEVLKAQDRELKVTQQQLFDDPECRIKDLIMFPIRVVEYDANAFVRRRIETWKKSGIDLSGNVQHNGSSVSVMQYLDDTIQRTYGVTRDRMTVVHDDGHSYIPLLEE